MLAANTQNCIIQPISWGLSGWFSGKLILHSNPLLPRRPIIFWRTLIAIWIPAGMAMPLDHIAAWPKTKDQTNGQDFLKPLLKPFVFGR